MLGYETLDTVAEPRVLYEDGARGPRWQVSLSLFLTPFFLHFLLCILFCWIIPFITGLSHPFFGRGFPLYILLLTLLGPDNSFLSQGAGRFPQEINFGGIYPQQPQHLIVTDLSEACCEIQLWKHLG